MNGILPPIPPITEVEFTPFAEQARRVTLAALGVNPRVAIFVRNPPRDRRTLRFYGEALS